MKTLLIIFFYFFLGSSQIEVYERVNDLNLPSNIGYFKGDVALYVYDHNTTHIVCFRDSVCFEVGAHVPREKYNEYQEYCDENFIRVANDHFFGDGFKVAFLNTKNPDKFVIVAYEGENYENR